MTIPDRGPNPALPCHDKGGLNIVNPVRHTGFTMVQSKISRTLRDKANCCSDLISVETMTYLEADSFARNGQLGVPRQTPSPSRGARSAPAMHDATTAGSRNGGQTRSDGGGIIVSSFSAANGSGTRAGSEPAHGTQDAKRDSTGRRCRGRSRAGNRSRRSECCPPDSLTPPGKCRTSSCRGARWSAVHKPRGFAQPARQARAAPRALPKRTPRPPPRVAAAAAFGFRQRER